LTLKTKINLHPIQRLIHSSQGTMAAFVRNRSWWIFCRENSNILRIIRNTQLNYIT